VQFKRVLVLSEGFGAWVLCPLLLSALTVLAACTGPPT